MQCDVVWCNSMWLMCSIYIYMYLSTYPSIYLSIYLSVFLSNVCGSLKVYTHTHICCDMSSLPAVRKIKAATHIFANFPKKRTGGRRSCRIRNTMEAWEIGDHQAWVIRCFFSPGEGGFPAGEDVPSLDTFSVKEMHIAMENQVVRALKHGGFYAHSTGNSGKRDVVFASKTRSKNEFGNSASRLNPIYDLYASAFASEDDICAVFVTPNHIPGQVGASKRKHSILLLTTGSKEIGWIRNSSFASSFPINGTLSFNDDLLFPENLECFQWNCEKHWTGGQFHLFEKKTCSMLDVRCVCWTCVVDEVHFC